ncbi:cellulase family glycosylhydrolase [Paracoccus endophyticus]|uniref:cellulase family glycosylhydrolase n=1 Tax=Paracoccus endophyticus TaxID=2233774 RepID=UPI000DDBEA69|nr:cellulase family glycosylhydrolase [Paracoccus endophyticus]
MFKMPVVADRRTAASQGRRPSLAVPGRPILAGLAALILGLGGPQGAAAQGTVIPKDAVGLAVGLDALRWQDSLDLRAELADYAAMGVRWLRTDLNWGSVQKDGPDSFDWTEMDRIVDLAAAVGIGLLPVVGSAPEWAWSDPEGPSPPRDPAEFARFVAAAVDRYAPRGISTWEIWNEPNLDGPFPPRPDAAAYAALLKAAAPAIRAADPDATIILGGLAAVTDTDSAGEAIAAVEFLEAVYAQGAGGSFDAVGFHPYTGEDLPDLAARGNSWRLMAGPIRDIMVAQGDAAKPIWITEYGAPTNEADGGVSEARQAELLTAGVAVARATPWLGPLFWYSYRDLGDDPTYPEDWFGLMDGAGRAKPARAALERAVRPAAQADTR